MLILLPTTWLIAIPGNYLVDSLVLLLGMHLYKVEEKKVFYKRHIFKIFAFGFLADFIGSLLMMSAVLLGWSNTTDEIYLTLPSLLVAEALIYVFNYYITFKKVESPVRKKLAILFTILTAPYTLLIPIDWIY
jgi:hypothetical protein